EAHQCLELVQQAGHERLSSRLHVQRIPWLRRRLQLLILEPSALLTAAFLSRYFSSSHFFFWIKKGCLFLVWVCLPCACVCVLHRSLQRRRVLS
ncbi:unnamed protein product, partial [Ascophyllum nodosum]